MGWNTGFTIFEATVIGAYDLGKLDKDLLAVLMEPYRGTDIDSGGKECLKTKDGKEVEEVVIEVWGGSVPARPTVPNDPRSGDDPWGEYWGAIDEAFSDVTDHFGWC